MTRRIKPRFDSFDVRTNWDEGENRWAKVLAVFIFNDLEKKIKLPLLTDKHTVGEEFYIIVCSSQFHQQPNEEVTEQDLRQAIIMDKYSEGEIEEELKAKIDTLGDLTFDEFESRMGKMFNMSDWYSQED